MHAGWQKRAVSTRRCIYVWAEGIHLEARLEDEKQCIPVIIGATPEGRKELVGFFDGARESAHEWRELLLALKRRELVVAPTGSPTSSTSNPRSSRRSQRQSLASRRAPQDNQAAAIGRNLPIFCNEYFSGVKALHVR